MTIGEIYVLTPKGRVVYLPDGATPVDFAYKVHSQVGDTCSGAKVNGRIVPLSTKLKSGDIIEILTQSNKGPSRDWLRFVAMPQTKSKIKGYFRKKMESENIKLGKTMLEGEAKQRGYQLNELLIQSSIDNIILRQNLQSVDDMFASVGYGGHTTNQILTKLIDLYKREQALKGIPIENQIKTGSFRHKKGAVIVENYSDFLVKFPKCCSPVLGDPIVGFATKGTGVTIHRIDCSNVESMEKERLMNAKWAETNTQDFVVYFRIETIEKVGILNQITQAISSQGYSIQKLNVDVTPKNEAFISIGIVIKNTNDVEYLTKKIGAIAGVLVVKRVNG